MDILQIKYSYINTYVYKHGNKGDKEFRKKIETLNRPILSVEDIGRLLIHQFASNGDLKGIISLQTVGESLWKQSASRKTPIDYYQEKIGRELEFDIRMYLSRPPPAN